MLGRRVLAAAAAAATALALAGCEATTPAGTADVPSAPAASATAETAIAAGETITLTGTEPFWGGTVAAQRFTYSTPEIPDGRAIAVKRFAGLNGLGFSGTLDGKPLDLAITVAPCSDGMSDRSYPFVATLRIGEETRSGCAWTDRRPFAGPEAP